MAGSGGATPKKMEGMRDRRKSAATGRIFLPPARLFLQVARRQGIRRILKPGWQPFPRAATGIRGRRERDIQNGVLRLTLSSPFPSRRALLPRRRSGSWASACSPGAACAGSTDPSHGPPSSILHPGCGAFLGSLHISGIVEFGGLAAPALAPSRDVGLTLAFRYAYLPAFKGVAPFPSMALSPLFPSCPSFRLACWMCPLA